MNYMKNKKDKAQTVKGDGSKRKRSIASYLIWLLTNPNKSSNTDHISIFCF